MKIEKLKHEIIRKLPVNAAAAEKLILLAFETNWRRTLVMGGSRNNRRGAGWN